MYFSLKLKAQCLLEYGCRIMEWGGGGGAEFWGSSFKDLYEILM